MNNHLAVFKTPPLQRSRRLRVTVGCLAFVAALQCAPLLADEVASHNATSMAQEQVPWMSGGIGDEARDEMRKAAAAYNVHLVFSDRLGNYLADIPFSVARRDGRKIHTGVSEGPLLYLKLPPGSYQISAEMNGLWQSKRIQASASGNSVKTSFVAMEK
jgi:hypothetical protein